MPSCNGNSSICSRAAIAAVTVTATGGTREKLSYCGYNASTYIHWFAVIATGVAAAAAIAIATAITITSAFATAAVALF